MEESEADLYLQMYIDNPLFEKANSIFQDDSNILSQLIIFVLLNIGFPELNIRLIDTLIGKEKILSRYELKLYGFSNEEISSLFYLIDHKNVLFKKEQESYCVKGDFSCSEDCSICLNSLVNSENIVKLFCKHMFHMDCISQWESTCPNCRYPFENVYQYPKLIRNWKLQCSDAVCYLNSIKEQCNTGIRIVK